MKKFICLVVTMLAIVTGVYFYLNNRATQVVAVHQNAYVTSIIVDHLPLSKSARVGWWLKNQDAVINHYAIKPKNEKGVINYFFYAFAEGYKKEGDEDRLCFEEMSGPVNCIDKNLLMMVMRTPEGGKQYIFDDGYYIQSHDGSLSGWNAGPAH